MAEANLATARRRAQMVQRQAELGRSAYEQGELDLMDLLRLEESAVTTDRHLARLEVEVARQVALYNQSVGDMP